MIGKANRDEVERMIFHNGSDKPPAVHPATLNEIQIRAYRIHQEHGAVYGGYSLDEWLEAEHELGQETRGSCAKTEKVH